MICVVLVIRIRTYVYTYLSNWVTVKWDWTLVNAEVSVVIAEGIIA